MSCRRAQSGQTFGRHGNEHQPRRSRFAGFSRLTIGQSSCARARPTRRLYEFSVRNFGAFLGREATLEDFTDDAVSRLLAWMIERGLSPYTANKERSQLLAIWRFAARKRFVEDWPDVEPEIQPKRDPRAWTENELARLFTACSTVTGMIADIPAAAWWTALHYVAWFTAERIGAVLKLRWSDLDAQTGWLVVPAEARKGRRADKSTRLPSEAINALKAIREPRRDLLFPWDRSPSYIYRRYQAQSWKQPDFRLTPRASSTE